MARINVEPSLFQRGEWLKLLIKTGSPDCALGALVRCWMTAQRFWYPNRKPIPKKVWEKEGLSMAVLECGLAETKDDGIYVKGSEEQFAWLFAAKENGRKGGVESAKKRAKSNIDNGEGKRGSSKVKHSGSKSNPLPLSLTLPLYSFSSSSSDSNSTSDSVNKNKNIGRAKKARPYGGNVWEAYRKAYVQRYTVEPVRGAKSNTFCCDLVEAVGEEDAKSLVKFYVDHNEAFYLKVTHSLNILVRDIQPLMTQMKRGKKFTSNDIRQYEKGQHYRDQMERIDKGEL